MARLARTIALTTAFASGCFVDGGETPDGDDTGGTSSAGAETSSGVVITEGPITLSASSPTTLDTGDDTTTSTGPDTADSTDSDTDTDTDTDTDDGTSSSSSGGPEVLTVPELVIGDLVITEMMGNPQCTGDNCEWFEVLNTTDLPIDLFGLGIGDRDAIDAGSPDTAVNQHILLGPGELGVFARIELWPYEDAVEPLVRYSNAVALSNGEFDTIGLFGANDFLLDEAATFYTDNEQVGRSRKLRMQFWNAADNDDSAHWCWSNTPLPSNSLADDWGTPGYDADDCLPPG